MKPFYFRNCTTLEEVKKRYKELAMLHHPDRNGDTATMQAINAEYENVTKINYFSFSEKSEQEQQEFIKYPDIINQIVVLPGIIIEIIGDWIWISGNTYGHKTILKEIGFFFAPKKLMWYYRPADYKSSNRKPKTIDYIRSKYGSDKIDAKSTSFELQN
jgi:hypothetical protein